MGALSFNLALVFYFASVLIGIFELLRGARPSKKEGGAMPPKKMALSRLVLFFAGLGFFAHTANFFYRYAAAGHLPVATPHEATAFFAWCVVFLFFVIEFKYKVGLLSSFLMPIAFALLFSASMLPREIMPLKPILRSNWFALHTTISFMANAAFALAFSVGVMYLVQEHYVKSKRLGELFGRLPDLQTLDRINYRLITIGFPLFTMGIISGALWADRAWGSYWRWDPREVWSLITWLIFALILHTRVLMGWRGRRAAILTTIGFLTILLAFFGIKLLKKGMHVF